LHSRENYEKIINIEMVERPAEQSSQKTESNAHLSKLDRFMYDHGRVLANTASVARVPGAPIVAGLILADMPRSALAAHTLFSLTDVIDGWAARKSKGGSSAFWGKWDPRIDRIYSISVEAALAIKKPQFRKHFAARTTREAVMYGLLRPAFHKKGIDTSATRISKNSTAGATIAQGFEIVSFGEINPAANEVVQSAATGLKVASVVSSPRTWLRKHREKREEDKKAA
jgi:phosphatidylglycerophosphate synthase